ncbi:MAG: zinc ribbon domain-containing protein [Planctomycetes bacterium]|jgi:putative FmdB family regulatory protein|nr:zinc ribbon domain-containing protein [Phycisphaerae bacterium]NBB94225.1 zinc ribbon domain-containing protein [Planctomycetota bacterium]
MPTYDYECEACGHEFEKFQSITASAIRKCPTCGKLKVRRRIGTGAGVIFKGSGFYETDYRSDSYRKSAENDKPSASSDTASDTSKDKASSSDSSTPATKSEGKKKAAEDSASA